MEEESLVKRRCHRCSGRIFIVPTEFNFYVPQCITCGYEDYGHTIGMKTVKVDSPEKTYWKDSDSSKEKAA